MKKQNRFAALLAGIAGCAVAVPALAQPVVDEDLGSITQYTPTVINRTFTCSPANPIQWFKIVVPAATNPNAFLDIFTSGTVGDDTEVGLYRADGTLVDSDDDDGAANYSALSYGSTDFAFATRVNPLANGAQAAGVASNGRDGASDIAPGIYYIAVGNYNVTFGTTAFNVTTNSTGTGTHNIDIRYNGIAPANPAVNSVASTPATGYIGSSSTVVVNVARASDNVAISSVSLDASAIDSGTVALNDSGIAPDATAGDNNWSGTVTVGAAATLGAKTLTALATDASARTATGTGSYTVVVAPPANDICSAGATLDNAGPYPIVATYATAGATVDGTWTGCSTFTPTGPDVWFSYTAPSDGVLTVSTCNADTGATTQVDTLLGITSSCGSAFTICEDDDEDDACGLGTKISATLSAGVTYKIGVRTYGTTAVTAPVSVNFVAGTPFGITATSTSEATIFTNGAPSSTVVTATVQNASLPPSTGVTVSLDASAAGLGTISMLDNGVAPDAVSGDSIYSGTLNAVGATIGDYTFTISAADAEARTATGTVDVTIDQVDETGETVATANLAPSATAFDARLNSTTDVDVYKIYICDPATFSATTVGGLTPAGTATGSDTSLYLFKADGTGVSFNDDVSGSVFNSAMDSTQVLASGPGEYYLAISYFANDPFDATALEMWLDAPYTGTRAPDGDGAAGSLGDWQGTGTITNYTLTMTGVSLTPCTTGPTCNDLDFNNDGNIEPLDVDAYFSVLGEGPCLGDIGVGCDSLDFNNDGNIEPLDVDSYFSVLGEGPCI